MASPVARLRPSPTAAFLADVHRSLDEIDEEAVETIAERLTEAWRRDARVFVMGNGGSAATASHFASDLQAATRSHRALAASSLTDGIAAMTALSNDRGYENLFREQLLALARPGDLVVAISASGDSENVLRGLEAARERGALALAFLGSSGGRALALVESAVVVTSSDFGVVESVHAAVAHLVASRVRGRVGA